MDGDPAVEPELDTFSLYLPLPYRVAFVLVLGIYRPYYGRPIVSFRSGVSTDNFRRHLGLGSEPSLPFSSQDRTFYTFTYLRPA